MRKTKLYYYLSEMDDPERASLRTYLESELGANSPLYAHILDVMQEKVLPPDAPAVHRDATHAQFFAWIYPDRPYNANYCHRVLSGLLTAVLDFIAWTHYRADPRQRDHNLLRALNRRARTRYFPALQAQATRRLDGQAQSIAHLGHAAAIARETRTFQARNPTRNSDLALGYVLDALDQDFILRKLAYACAAINQDRILGTSHEILFLAPIIAEVSRNLAAQAPLIQSYYHVYQGLYEPENRAHFDALMQALQDHGATFAKGECQELYQYAENFCIVRLQAGDGSFVEDLFEVLQIQIGADLLRIGGSLPLGKFRNSMTIFLSFRAYDAAEKFLAQSWEQLQVEYRKMAWSYHTAAIAFHRGEFAEALAIFQQKHARFRETHYALGGRAYLCKCYFELGDEDALEGELEAFRKALARQRDLPARQLGNYQNFVQRFATLLRILRGNPDTRRAELQEFVRRLAAQGASLLTTWLLAKGRQHLTRMG